MRPLHSLSLALAIFMAACGARAETAAIASIKPVHALVAAVMEGVGEPALVMEGAGSPHAYSLRPSQARAIERADIVFWIGHDLEAFLEKPIETLAAEAVVVELGAIDGLTLLEPRRGGAFEPHEPPAGEPAGADPGHEHGAFDMHLWLDPQNAAAMVRAIAETLAQADPANASRYRANARATLTRLDELSEEIGGILAPVKDMPFIVFHDAYHYFENRFGLRAAGSVTVSPEIMPGAERVARIRQAVQRSNAACVFAEPQFEPKLMSAIVEGLNVRSARLDPLGAELTPGPALYFDLMRGLAVSLRDCLSAE